ncbi:MAG: DNRLRE domain-containing protein [Bacteroidia bacterium]
MKTKTTLNLILCIAFTCLISESKAQFSFNITPSGPTDICSPGSTLSASVDSPDVNVIYQWYIEDYSQYSSFCNTTPTPIFPSGPYVYIDPWNYPFTGQSCRVYCQAYDAGGNFNYSNALNLRIAGDPIPVCVTTYNNNCGYAVLQPPVNLWYGYTTWYLNGVQVSISATSNFYNATQSGNYYCRIQTNCGYSYSDTFYVNINPLPVPTAAANGPVTFCPGGSVTLNGTTTGATSYLWFKNTASTGINTPTFVANATGSYYVVVTDANGCQGASNTIAVTVLSGQTITVSDTALCTGDTATLTSSNAATYQWKKNGVNISGATSQVYKATTSGTYKVTVTGSTCTGTAPPVNVKFYVLANATVTLSGSPVLCFGEGVLMSVPAPAGAYTYQWKRNGLDINGATDPYYFTTVAGNFKAVVTNPGGCSKTSANVSITKPAGTLPTKTITLQPNAATGKDAMITGYLPSGNANFGTDPEFKAGAWTIGGVPFSERSLIDFDLSQLPAGAAITNAQLSLYYNPASNSYGHSHYGANAAYIKRITAAWSENTVTWNNQPPTATTHQLLLPQSISPTQDYTNMNVTDLLNDVYHNPATGYGLLLQLQQETIYKGLLFSSSDHPDSTKHPKLVITFVAANIAAAGATTICTGDSVKLSTNAGTYSYQWYKGGVMIAGATSSSYYAKATGNYTVKLTNGNGCTASSSILFIKVNLLPAAAITASGATTFCAGDSVVLTANAGATLTYQWKKNNANISGATSKNYSAKTTGIFKVVVTNINGCTKLSNTIAVNVPCRIGETAGEISVFPNPANSNFTLHLDIYESVDLAIIDITGKRIQEFKNINSNDDFIFGDELTTGIYFLEVSSPSFNKTIKLVKTE